MSRPRTPPDVATLVADAFERRRLVVRTRKGNPTDGFLAACEAVISDREARGPSVDVSGLEPRHVQELCVHADKLRHQLENDERPAPEHGWTCFHCAQTFATYESASAHFGEDPIGGRPACVTDATLAHVRKAAHEAEREAAAAVAKDLARASAETLRLLCGEMTAGEVRTARAVLDLTARRILDRSD